MKKLLGIDFVYQYEQQLRYMSIKSKIIELYNRNVNLLPRPTETPIDSNTNFKQE